MTRRAWEAGAGADAAWFSALFSRLLRARFIHIPFVRRQDRADFAVGKLVKPE